MKKINPILVQCLFIIGYLLVIPVAANADIQQAQNMVVDTTEKTMAKLKQEEQTVRNNPDRLYAIVDEMVLPHFDFEKMSSWVLGKYWRKATAAQKERFTKEFKILLVRTYSNALLEAIGKKINFVADAFRNIVLFDGVVKITNAICPYFTVIFIQEFIDILFPPALFDGYCIIHDIAQS